MRLSRDEESFLRHWMYDEVHYQDGPGPAKRLQLEHGAVPADLATLIAAAIPDAADQRNRPASASAGPSADVALARGLAGERGSRRHRPRWAPHPLVTTPRPAQSPSAS